MKVAFTYWDNRIAPVFDSSQDIHVVDIESGKIVQETLEKLPDNIPIQKVIRLNELGISILVCGAISSSMHEAVLSHGIKVIPFVTGNLHVVINALLHGVIKDRIFSMPGCRRHGCRKNLKVFFCHKETENMNQRKGQGQGSGGGRGIGRGQGEGRGQRGGRMGGGKMGGPAGNCVCPKCGQILQHERGVPCNLRKCPSCGTLLARQ